MDFLRGKGEGGLETGIETGSCSESTTSGVTCGSGEGNGEMGIGSTETLSAESGSTAGLSFKKVESEKQESGTERGKTNEVESTEGES